MFVQTHPSRIGCFPTPDTRSIRAAKKSIFFPPWWQLRDSKGRKCSVLKRGILFSLCRRCRQNPLVTFFLLCMCVCARASACLTIDSHAISWWVFVRCRLCDTGCVSPSMVSGCLFTSSPLFSLHPPHLSSYLLTPYYSGWRPQDLMESMCARVCERGRLKTRQLLIFMK